MLDGHDSPHYSVLCRRINHLDGDIDGGVVRVSDRGTPMMLLADASGLKQCNRGEWVRQKWKVRRGFVKIHLLADAGTKRILAAMVTDDKTGDSPVLEDLLGTVVERRNGERQERRTTLIRGRTDAAGSPLPRVDLPPPNNLTEGMSPLALLCGRRHGSHGACLMADGAYASRANMRACKGIGIRPLIPIQTRCNARGKSTGDAWGEAVREQFGGSPEARVGGIGTEEREENKRYWKSTVGYNRRWLIEIIISACKRMSGDHMHSRKWEHMVQEIRLRAAQYNRWQEAGV